MEQFLFAYDKQKSQDYIEGVLLYQKMGDMFGLKLSDEDQEVVRKLIGSVDKRDAEVGRGIFREMREKFLGEISVKMVEA